ncbi:MAG TPA: phasin [Pseudolabrys sp.]|nr:phasin [Pseudolabrys sp.]
MAEPNTAQTQTQKPKQKPAATGAYDASKFDMPRFELPKFEVPKMEVPAMFREFAEKGIAQAKDNYEKMKSVAEEATDRLETTYATASKGACDYGLKLIEHARANSNAAFDLAGELLAAKSYSEVVELYTAYLRDQFDTVSRQTRDLADCAQKAASETVEPLKEGFNSALRKAA